ncbi:MAG TPA: hypothetical protein VFC19_50355 [Candidatus Limnocylindrales bacterium]|nr:hypothetical protein [Candidatus Limnocylindrales bacterium]
MNPIVAFTLLAAGTARLAVPLSAPVQVHVYTSEVRVAPGGAVQEFTLDCKPGQSVLSGGFRHITPELRVVASYPSPAKAAWVVSAALPDRTPADLTLSVVCAEGDIRTAVKVATGDKLSVSTQCPQGTIVTGGGYSSGNAAFLGSYPAVGEGWAVTAISLPGNEIPNLTVYAVCASGAVRPAGAGMETLQVPASVQSPCPQTITPTTRGAPACGYIRSGGLEVPCEGTLVGGGYEVAEGQMPPFAIAGAGVSREAWQVTVNGRGPDNGPLSVRLIAICILLPEPDPVVVGPPIEPVAERDEVLPLIASSCVVAALLLALVLVMSARMRSRTRKGQQAQVAVVLRSHHSSFRLDEFREVR